MTGLESPTKLLFLLLIAVLLCGAKRLPEVGRTLGSGMREFKNAVSGLGPRELLGQDPAEPEPESLSTD